MAKTKNRWTIAIMGDCVTAYVGYCLCVELFSAVGDECRQLDEYASGLGIQSGDIFSGFVGGGRRFGAWAGRTAHFGYVGGAFVRGGLFRGGVCD